MLRTFQMTLVSRCLADGLKNLETICHIFTIFGKKPLHRQRQPVCKFGCVHLESSSDGPFVVN